MEAGAFQLRHPNSGRPGNHGRDGKAGSPPPGSPRPPSPVPEGGSGESPAGHGDSRAPALLPGRGCPGGRAARRFPPPRRAHGLSPTPPPQGRLPERRRPGPLPWRGGGASRGGQGEGCAAGAAPRGLAAGYARGTGPAAHHGERQGIAGTPCLRGPVGQGQPGNRCAPGPHLPSYCLGGQSPCSCPLGSREVHDFPSRGPTDMGLDPLPVVVEDPYACPQAIWSGVRLPRHYTSTSQPTRNSWQCPINNLCAKATATAACHRGAAGESKTLPRPGAGK